MTETVTMYRPVGKNDLKLIEESGFSAHPPRLPDQPIFHPVSNEGYARQIATIDAQFDAPLGERE